MMMEHETITIKSVPVERIVVLNPRVRNKKQFRQIIDSISNVGLKKPITVSRNQNGDGEASYQLVCGQGRLEAFIALGENEIPAIVVDVTEEDSLIMSLYNAISLDILAVPKYLNFRLFSARLSSQLFPAVPWKSRSCGPWVVPESEARGSDGEVEMPCRNARN